MKRTNISLTEEQYKELKENAYRNGVSMSFIIRGLLLKIHEPEMELPKGHHLYTYPEPSPPKEIFEPQPKPKKK